MTSAVWPLWPSVLALVGAAVVIGVAGYRLTKVADQLATRTGLGQALAGFLLLGAVTSLPGIVTTITGALSGDAEFTLANPVGGVAVQTVWIVIADLAYRRANLEHAAASLENLMQTVVLLALLAVPVVAYATPTLSFVGLHPASFAIPLLYLYGLRLTHRMRDEPMWHPERTADTDDGDDSAGEHDDGTPLRRLWLSFVLLGAVVGVTGWVIGRAGLSLVAETGLPGGFVGFTVTTAITSLPELVTVLAAIRLRALTLGIADIVGGNSFDTLMIFVADAAYRGGPIYVDAGASGLLLTGGTSLMTAIVAGGLLMRARRGIGFEGVAVVGTYVAVVVLLLTVG